MVKIQIVSEITFDRISAIFGRISDIFDRIRDIFDHISEHLDGEAAPELQQVVEGLLRATREFDHRSNLTAGQTDASARRTPPRQGQGSRAARRCRGRSQTEWEGTLRELEIQIVGERLQ